MGQLAVAANERQQQLAAQGSYDDAVKNLIRANIKAIKKMVPSTVTPARVLQLSMEALRRTPKLRECSPESFVAALTTCSALGLEPSAVDGLGNAYIIPRYNKATRSTEATFELGYPGAIILMHRAGVVRDITARVVHENDVFELELGTSERLRHVPAARNAGAVTHVYCIAKLVDGTHHVEVMTKEEIDRHRNYSSAKDRGPWATHYEEMAKKTVVLYASKWLPRSAEVQKARAFDGTAPRFEGEGATEEVVPGERTWDDEVAVEYEEA